MQQGESEGKTIRLQEEKRMLKVLKKKLPNNFIYFGPRMGDKGEILDIWDIKFSGRKDTNLYPGFYECELIFPKDYPIEAPKLKFKNGFKHMHVYATSDVCLPLINQMHWIVSVGNIDIALALENMVHDKPKADDAANYEMKEMFKKNEKDYFDFLQKQAKDFEKYK